MRIFLCIYLWYTEPFLLDKPATLFFPLIQLYIILCICTVHFCTLMSCNSLLANVVCFTCTTLNKVLSYLILSYDQTVRVIVMNDRPPSLLFNVNRPSHSWDMAISKFDHESESHKCGQSQGHIVGSATIPSHNTQVNHFSGMWLYTKQHVSAILTPPANAHKLYHMQNLWSWTRCSLDCGKNIFVWGLGPRFPVENI